MSDTTVVLHGRARQLARGYWLFIAALSIFFMARSLPSALNPIDDDPEGFPSSTLLREGLAQLHVSELLFELMPFLLSVAVATVMIALAVLLFIRRGDELGPLVLGIFFLTAHAGTFPPEIADIWTRHHLLAAAAVVETLTWLLAFYWLFVIFPDGRVRQPRVGLLGTALLVGAFWEFLLSSASSYGGFPGDALLLPATLLLALYAQVHRWRHTHGVEARQQMKWAAFSLGIALSGFVSLNVALGLHDWEHETNGVLAVFVTLGFFVGLELLTGLVVALGFTAAIFRYRLYDIDVFISRALVYVGLTAGFIVIYLVSVIVFDLGLNAGLGVASPVALAVSVVAFEPLRRRLQSAINRLMFGQRGEPYAVLVSLGTTLGETLSPALVPGAIASTITASLRLRWAAIELDEERHSVAVAESGTRASISEERFSITHSGQSIGTLAVQPRPGERALSKRDRRLIEDLCLQSGPALAGLQLTEDLQHSRERLVTAREEERRRLRRDLHDGIGPRLAGLALRVETARDLAEEASPLRGSLDDLADRLQDTVADIRRLVYGLRPPALDDLGLIGALRQVTERDDPTGTRIRLEVDEPLPPLSAAVEAAAFRIVQEALTNVARHATGAATRVSLRYDPPSAAFLVTVSDHGPGARPGHASGVGLHSMRERAEELGGSFTFESGAGGSTVNVRLPLHTLAAPDEASPQATCPPGTEAAS